MKYYWDYVGTDTEKYYLCVENDFWDTKTFLDDKLICGIVKMGKKYYLEPMDKDILLGEDILKIVTDKMRELVADDVPSVEQPKKASQNSVKYFCGKCGQDAEFNAFFDEDNKKTVYICNVCSHKDIFSWNNDEQLV